MTTPTGSVAFTASLPVDVLMKSAPAIMATWEARATVTSVAKSPVPRMTFIRVLPQASRNARTSSYTASQLPASACARGDRGANLGDPLGQGTEARREPGRHGRHGDLRAVERLHGDRDERVIDADGAHRELQVLDAQRLNEIAAHGMLSLGTQSQHVGGRVVALQRGEVHAGDGPQQPGGLPLALHGAAGGDRDRAALDGAAVHMQRSH